MSLFKASVFRFVISLGVQYGRHGYAMDYRSISCSTTPNLPFMKYIGFLTVAFLSLFYLSSSILQH